MENLCGRGQTFACLCEAPSSHLGWVCCFRVPRSNRSTGNPAGFNSERWLLGNGITATGSVRHWQALSVPGAPDWRERRLAQAKTVLSPFPQSALLMALVFGEQQAVSPPRIGNCCGMAASSI